MREHQHRFGMEIVAFLRSAAILIKWKYKTHKIGEVNMDNNPGEGLLPYWKCQLEMF